MKIQTATDVLLQTYNSVGTSSDADYTVLKEPIGAGRYRISARTHCANMFGCIPKEENSRSELLNYIATGQDIGVDEIAYAASRATKADTVPAARSSLVAYGGWQVSLTNCTANGSAIHCALTVKNASAEKRGFRLENVRGYSVASNELSIEARDFTYDPRASFGTDHVQGNCESGAVCSVQFSFDAPALDHLTLSISTWGASWSGSKQSESPTLTLTVGH